IVAEFSAVPLEGMAPHGVVFTDASTGVINTWHWEFGDGDTSDVANPIHIYDEPGSYDVTLTVSGGGSDSETKEGYINVYVESPVIDLVADVPADQGGWAYLHFTGSWYDRLSETVQPVDEYAVYRRIDGVAAAAELAEKGETLISGSPAAETLPPGTWAVVLNVPATQSGDYIALVPTVADSSASFDYSVYVVGAFTTTPSVFFYSQPDSGYSVDDLSPAPPAMLAGDPVYTPAPGLDLTWNPNTDDDLSHYAVYRGLDADFVPAPGNLLGTPASNTFFDGGWVWSTGYWYKVAAVDIHGNESEYALLGPAEITGDDRPGPPVRDYLAQNHPNPFNPSTTIRFGLSRDSRVSLKIFDTTGRLVRVIVDGSLPAGHYRENWDGLNSRGVPVSSGIYYYRLAAPGYDRTC
ncbi:MAG TPA: PKD domain-containing protein, partial [Candidatus Krumholzibacterium sp.]|nr:PKD domain-containing protein [Candidatus Krumholzibacterium sp.]